MKSGMQFTAACVAAGLLATAAAAQQPPAPPEVRRAESGRVFIHKAGSSYLGIGVVEIDAERAKALNLKEERGVEVKTVDEGGPAAKAGLKEGDVVLEYNGQRVEGTEQFVRMVRETPPGRQARMTIWRGGAGQSLTATIGTRPAGGLVARFGDQDYAFTMPPIPPIPAIPDLPRTVMSWRSTSLGIESESLSSQLAEFFGVQDGVLVRSVNKNSPAEKAGIRAGDVIVKVDDSKVTSPREISGVLRSLRSKASLTVVLVRDKKEMTVTITREDLPGMRGVRPVTLTALSC
jgi:serine protease Do